VVSIRFSWRDQIAKSDTTHTQLFVSNEEEEVVGTEVVGIGVVEEVVAVVGIGPVEALDCTPAGFAERELKRNH